MNINELTIGQAKELAAMFGNNTTSNEGLSSMIGEKVIVRTYSCGVHYGELVEKNGTEVILKQSRMFYYWKTTDGGISLNEIANNGVHGDSKLCAAVDRQWLDAIGIIPCTKKAIKNIEAKNEYTR